MRARTMALCCSMLLAFTLTTTTAGMEVAPEYLGVASPGVTVTNPNLLPPPGSGAGWIDHPCSHELRYDIEGTENGHPATAVLALAHAAIVTSFGTPSLSTVGNDVISTFSATLHIAATVVVGFPVDPPMDLALPGTITARFVGKAGRTTGTFLLRLDAMSFATTLFSIPVEARQDPSHLSTGSVTITDLGNGTYRVMSGLDAYTQIRIYISADGAPAAWQPWDDDLFAPVHFELSASSCPPASFPVANFTVTPAAPLSGHPVTFTDTSTGSPPPTSWSWDFGDGATSTARNPTHTYASAGTLVVRLTVTSAGGPDSVAKLETVAPGTPPDPRKQVHRVMRGTVHGKPVG